jgi:hypothetical protein
VDDPWNEARRVNTLEVLGQDAACLPLYLSPSG